MGEEMILHFTGDNKPVKIVLDASITSGEIVEI